MRHADTSRGMAGFILGSYAVIYEDCLLRINCCNRVSWVAARDVRCLHNDRVACLLAKPTINHKTKRQYNDCSCKVAEQEIVFLLLRDSAFHGWYYGMGNW